MIAYPGSILRVALYDEVTIEPALAECDGATLEHADGTSVSVGLSGGALAVEFAEAPDTVAVTWTEGGEPRYLSTIEVVERHYFTLDQLRGYDGGRDGFESLDGDVLFMARQAATEVFEMAAARCFVTRIGRKKDYGRSPIVNLFNDVQDVRTEGYEVYSNSTARRMPGVAVPAIVEYTYGTGYVPAAVSAAVLMLAAYTLRPSNRPIGATGESTDAGYIHFTTAGRDGVTAIPEVNAAAQQFGAGWRFAW